MLVRLRCRFEMMSTSRFYFSFRHEKQHTAAEVVVMLFFFFVWKAVYRQALLSLPQFVEKVCIYKNRANSLSLSPCPLSPGKGENTGTAVPATCLGATPKARTLWLLAKSFARCKTNIASNAKHPFSKII